MKYTIKLPETTIRISDMPNGSYGKVVDDCHWNGAIIVRVGDNLMLVKLQEQPFDATQELLLGTVYGSSKSSPGRVEPVLLSFETRTAVFKHPKDMAQGEIGVIRTWTADYEGRLVIKGNNGRLQELYNLDCFWSTCDSLPLDYRVEIATKGTKIELEAE